jgi:DNA-nicking Smr family endonuclease
VPDSGDRRDPPKPDDEAALFRNAIDGVRPLTHERVMPQPTRKPPPLPRHRRRLADAHPHLSDADFAPAFEPMYEAQFAPGDLMSFARDGVSASSLRRLRRGKTPVERRLDLHGMTSRDAHNALASFLVSSSSAGVRCLLIVHGKGYGSPDGRSVLKSKLDHWLRLEPRVMAFTSAPRHDGGTGALYVLLKA